jgi:hypothetical protein
MSTVATIEGLDLLGEDLKGYSVTSAFSFDDEGKGNGHEAEPPEETAKKLVAAATANEKQLEGNRRIACVAKSQAVEALNRVRKLDVQVALLPAGNARDDAMRRRKVAAVLAIRHSKTHAAAVIVARDQKRHILLRKAAAVMLRKGKKNEANALIRADKAITAHEKTVRAVRMQQQRVWACGTAGMRKQHLTRFLGRLQAHKRKLERIYARLGERRAALSGKQQVSLARLQAARLDRMQNKIATQLAKVRTAIEKTDQAIRSAGEPCKNLRQTPGRKPLSKQQLGMRKPAGLSFEFDVGASAGAEFSISAGASAEASVGAKAATSTAPVAKAVETQIKTSGKAAEKFDAQVLLSAARKMRGQKKLSVDFTKLRKAFRKTGPKQKQGLSTGAKIGIGVGAAAAAAFYAVS